MRGFEIILNGTPYCLAAVGESGILSAFVTWVHVEGDTETDVPNPSGSTLLSVTGTTPDGTPVHWGEIVRHLRTGDELTIRILDTDAHDPWTTTVMLPPLEHNEGDDVFTPDPAVRDVTVTDEALSVELRDGRTLSVPLSWYPRLVHGTPAERARWRLIDDDEGIHWPDLDEDIHTAHLLLGLPSAESAESLAAWLAGRKEEG